MPEPIRATPRIALAFDYGRRRVQREDIDSAAAALILMRWLAGEGDPKT